MTDAIANKRRILSTVAVILLIAAMGVYAYTTLTANTGTITVTTRPPSTNIIIMAAHLNWNGGGEDCAASSGGSGPWQTITCPPSGPTVYVGDSLQLQIQFGNTGNTAGTLNRILYTTDSGNNNTLALHDARPCYTNSTGCGHNPPVFIDYPVTIPVNGQPHTPVQVAWIIDAVSAGSDAATFTFDTSG